jgi:hypothetical protein
LKELSRLPTGCAPIENGLNSLLVPELKKPGVKGTMVFMGAA